MRLHLTMLALMLSGTAAVAQPWPNLQTENPPGALFTMHLIDAHPYREGELLRAEVRYSGPSLDPIRQPAPPERWQFAGLLLDPPAACGSPTTPCTQSPELGFDKNDPMLRLGETSNPLAVVLNTYLHALPAGRYRVALLARQLVLTSHRPMSNTYGYADPPKYTVSNTVEIEVVAATESWIRQTISASVGTLSGPPENAAGSYEKRRIAAQQIRFLDVPEAWNASLKLFPAEEATLLRGLAASRAPRQVCSLMQTAVPAPTQAVSSYYLSAMGEICTKATLPTPPAAKEHPEQQQEYWRKRYDYGQGLIDTAVAKLAAAISGKQGEAKAVAFQTLMERIQNKVANRPKEPSPEWLPAVSQEFVQSYPQFDAFQRRRLLGLYASTLHSPAMIPLLELVMDAWKPGDYYEAPQEALQDLYNIDPARAVARILSELSRERTWLDAGNLDMLPPSAAAHLTDDALIQSLAAAQRPGGWNVRLSMTALAKFASPKALPRIKAIYESQQDKCQPELMAYFVRVDPAYADRVFQSHPWDIRTPPPACTAQYFERTPPLAMSPGLERYLAAYLMQGDVRLKKTAAESLGKYGSPNAIPPLWGALHYFHDYWKGKEAELARNGEGEFLEVALGNAIARARHWLATDADLRTVLSLCVSDRCLYETQNDLNAWRDPLTISVDALSAWIRAQVAQYYNIESIDVLEEKLAQFPKGTHFTLSVHGENADALTARIRTFGAAHGLTVVSK